MHQPLVNQLKGRDFGGFWLDHQCGLHRSSKFRFWTFFVDVERNSPERGRPALAPSARAERRWLRGNSQPQTRDPPT